MNKKNNKRSCIASLRDMCIILDDGTEGPLSDEVEIGDPFGRVWVRLILGIGL